jgi:hypothetical protein
MLSASCVLISLRLCRDELQRKSEHFMEKEEECRCSEFEGRRLQERISKLGALQEESRCQQATERETRLESELNSLRLKAEKYCELASWTVFRNEELAQEVLTLKCSSSAAEVHEAEAERLAAELLAVFSLGKKKDGSAIVTVPSDETRLIRSPVQSSDEWVGASEDASVSDPCAEASLRQMLTQVLTAAKRNQMQFAAARLLSDELRANLDTAVSDVMSLSAHFEALQVQQKASIQKQIPVGSSLDAASGWCQQCARQSAQCDDSHQITNQLRESIAHHLSEFALQKEALQAANDALQAERDRFHDERNACVFEIEALRSQIACHSAYSLKTIPLAPNGQEEEEDEDDGAS